MFDDIKTYIKRLRSSGLRPTKQRLITSKALFSRPGTFHFTIESLRQIVNKNNKKKISLATLYNTIHAFKANGYLREISLKGDRTFFDTNTENHHHFYDEDTAKLYDIKNENISINKIPKSPNGKKIKEVEVILRIAGDNQIQKKQ